MANKSKSKGTLFETQVLTYLKEQGFGKVRRTPLMGGNDAGDINGISDGFGNEIILQCKNQKTFNLSGWLNDTAEQAENREAMLDNGGDVLGALVVKRPKVGPVTLGETYVVMRLEDFAQLLKEARYS